MKGLYRLIWIIQTLCIAFIIIFTYFKLILPIILCIFIFLLLAGFECYVVHNVKQVVAYIKILSNLTLSSDSADSVNNIKKGLKDNLTCFQRFILKCKFDITIK